MFVASVFCSCCFSQLVAYMDHFVWHWSICLRETFQGFCRQHVPALLLRSKQYLKIYFFKWNFLTWIIIIQEIFKLEAEVWIYQTWKTLVMTSLLTLLETDKHSTTDLICSELLNRSDESLYGSNTASRTMSNSSTGLSVGMPNQHLSASNPDLSTVTIDDTKQEYPDHVIKVFRADQTFKFLPIHKVRFINLVCCY